MNRDTKVFSKNDPHQSLYIIYSTFYLHSNCFIDHMTNSVNIPIANQPIMYNANNSMLFYLQDFII